MSTPTYSLLLEGTAVSSSAEVSPSEAVSYAFSFKYD